MSDGDPQEGGQSRTTLHIALLTIVWKDYIKRNVFFKIRIFTNIV